MSKGYALDSANLHFSAHTCWILGAGASYDCINRERRCVPLTRDLLQLKYINPSLATGLTRLQDKGFLERVDLAYLLGSRIEHTIDQVRGLTEDSNPVIAREASDCLRELIRNLTEEVSMGQAAATVSDDDTDGFSALNYYWLAFMCAALPNSSVITLNYDSILDWAFELLNSQSDIRPARQYLTWRGSLHDLFENDRSSVTHESGIYLKLHGSLHLYSCQNLGCAGYRRPFESKESTNGATIILNSRVECQICGQGALELILPPGRNKTRDEGKYHELVYSLAADALCRADTWVILGYSVPDYDQDVVDLLNEGLRRRCQNDLATRIQVISPHARDVGERLGRRVNHKVFATSIGFSILVDAAQQVGEVIYRR